MHRLAIAAVLLLAACATPRWEPDLVVLAPRLLDVRTGNIVENRAVIIDDGKIAGVEDSSLTLIVAENVLTLPANTILIPELGVPIVFGTDGTVLPHGENAKELEALVAVGLTPVEAIRAATLDAARLLGVEQRAGAIEPGFDADLVAVTSLVPLEVKLVIARGRVVFNSSQD